LSGGHVIRTSGYREAWKKAIITLNEGDKINLVDGEF
jgi:ribosomal protein L23